MKLLSLKYLILFAILLFPGEINRIHFSHNKNGKSEIASSQLIVNDSSQKNCLSLELRESKSRPTNQGEKVEPIVISSTCSNHSEIRFINLSVLQKMMFSKEAYSLSSPYYFLISQTVRISTLINILRI
jgi:hypothetical protein